MIGFDPSHAFRTLYQPPLLRGIHDFAISRELDSELICSEIGAHMSSMFSQMDKDNMSSSVLRRESLMHIDPCSARLKTFQTCLYCMLRKPEHVLSCGHAICDVCVVIFGEPAKGLEYHFNLSSCILCKKKLHFQAKLLPPTCGARLMSIDGGGIRGVVPLAYLAALQDTLGLPYPVQDHFDLCIGTSTGQLHVSLHVFR